jgi:hypothetical protein
MRELYYPASVKGRALRRLILAGVVRGERLDLEDEAIDRLEGELARALGEHRVWLAFYVGTPGAYRKITAQVLNAEGRTLAFAKIAASPTPISDVQTEYRVLRRLATARNLDGRVPEPLHLFDWRSAKVLLTTAGPPQPGPLRCSADHVEFCVRLFRAFAEERVFGESKMMRELSERTDKVGASMPGSAGLLHRSLDTLRLNLGPVTLPLSAAHRDFAPWNTRLGPQGLFVFDWDGARWGTTPLYDLFHFQAVQAALAGSSRAITDRRPLGEALEAIWPAGHGHLPSLYLAYLLDLALFYGEARSVAPEVGSSKVWDWLLARLDSFIREDLRF